MFQKKTQNFLIFIFIIFVVFIFVFFQINKKNSEDVLAQTSISVNLVGWAWSHGGGINPGVGWINFNCLNQDECNISDYGVRMHSDGDLSGYAWSGILGWLNFNPSSGYPHQPNHGVRVNLDNGRVSGWAQFVSGEWLLMNGDTFSGVFFDSNSGQFSGSAWGSDKLGWVNFAPSGADPVQINPEECLCNPWSDTGNCGEMGCASYQTGRTRECIPSRCGNENNCSYDINCGCGDGNIQSPEEECEANEDCPYEHSCHECSCQKNYYWWETIPWY